MGAVNLDAFNQLPVVVAQASGYLHERNISVRIDEITSGPRAMQALLGGSVDMISATFEQVLLLRAENRRIRSFLLMKQFRFGFL